MTEQSLVGSLRASLCEYRTAQRDGAHLAQYWREHLAEEPLPGRFRPVLEQLFVSAQAAEALAGPAGRIARADICDNFESWLRAWQLRCAPRVEPALV